MSVTKGVLKIEFGDNDFGCSLLALGDVIIEHIPLKSILLMYGEGALDEILTELFRACCCINQHRFDMYGYHGKKQILDDMSEYKTRDYFKITNATLHDNFEVEWDNGETLVVDMLNKQVHIM